MHRANSPAVISTRAEFKSLCASRRNALAISSLASNGRYLPDAASCLVDAAFAHHIRKTHHLGCKKARRVKDDPVSIVNLQHQRRCPAYRVRDRFRFNQSDVETAAQIRTHARQATFECEDVRPLGGEV